MEDIVIIGFGEHARTVADSIEDGGHYRIIGYTDAKRDSGTKYDYLGTDEILGSLLQKGVKYAVIGVGQIKSTRVREKIYSKAKKIGFELPVIIDPSAVISKGATIEEGGFIGKSATIEIGSKIGKACIINTCCMLSHDAHVGDFVHVSGHANVCGGAIIGDKCFIGAAATVISHVHIGSNVLIGAGTVVVKNVEDDMRIVNRISPIVTKRDECEL